MLVQEFAAVPDVHFSEVDSTFVEDSGRVEVTATLASHKRRGLALETIVARLSATDGAFRVNRRPARIGGKAFRVSHAVREWPVFAHRRQACHCPKTGAISRLPFGGSRLN